MTLEQLLDKPTLKNTRTIIATINSFVLLSSIAASGLLAFLVYVKPSRVLLIYISLLFAAGSVIACTYFKHAIRTFDLTSYRILKLEGILRIEPLGDYRRYHYRRLQRIEATRNGTRLIEFREHWTGKGSRDSLQAACVRPTDAMLLDGKVPEEDGRVRRWVYPTRPLGRGELLDIEVHQTHIDDVETQRPYFRQGGGHYDTDLISVSVTFPVEYEPTEIFGGVWNTARLLQQNQLIRKIDYTRTGAREEGIITYSVEVRKLPNDHSAGLAWTWPPKADIKSATKLKRPI